MNLKTLLIFGAVCLALVLSVGTAQAQLIAFYEFDGDMTDSVGSADGTGSPAYTTGIRGSALDIAGNGGRGVTVPVQMSPGMSEQITVGAWVKVSNDSAFGLIVQQDGDFARKLVIGNQLASNVYHYGSFAGYTDAQSSPNDGFNVFNATLPTAGNINQWVFMAAVYENSNASSDTSFVNTTVKASTDAWQRIAVGRDTTYIGSGPGWEATQGQVDDVFIFSGALSATEVATIRDAADPLAAANTISAGMSKTNADAVTTVKMDFQGSNVGGGGGDGATTATGPVAGWETWQPVARVGGGATATNMTDVTGAATTWDFELLNGLDGAWNAGGDDAAADYFYTLGTGDSYSPNWKISGLAASTQYRLTPITGIGGSPLFTMPDTDGDGDNYFGDGSESYILSEQFCGQTRDILATSSASGEIVGEFYFNQFWEGQVAGMVIEQIPEPSSIALAFFGLLGLALYGWRRRK